MEKKSFSKNVAQTKFMCKNLHPINSAISNSKTEVTLLLAFVGLLLTCSAFAEKADIFFFPDLRCRDAQCEKYFMSS